jgi:tetratricopeptide (TPR) repeat protein
MQTGGATSGQQGVTASDTEEADVQRDSALADLPDSAFEDVDENSAASDEGGNANAEGNGVADEGADDTGPPAPPETETTHTLEFTTSPGNAVVTIRNMETGERYDGMTPSTFDVPPGMYEWTVEKDGYLRKQSGQSIDLQTQRQEEISVNLVAGSGQGNYVDLGGQAYNNGNVEDAIQYYTQVPPPGPQEDETPYVRAQMRLGEMYWKDRGNSESAIRAYENVIEQDPTRYEAFLNLALLSYDIENYEDAWTYLNEASDLKFQIPQETRFERTLMIKYRKALVLYQQAQESTSQRQKRAKAQQALTSFQSFVSTVPADLESSFEQQIRDAEKKQEELRSLLRSIR